MITQSKQKNINESHATIFTNWCATKTIDPKAVTLQEACVFTMVAAKIESTGPVTHEQVGGGVRNLLYGC